VTTKKRVLAGVAGALVMVAGIVYDFEGHRSVDYLDPINIPTACVGHTGPDVAVGTVRTPEECGALLSRDLKIAWDAVDRLVTVPMTVGQHAAFTSFVFNVGERKFRTSTMLALANAGRMTEACMEFPRWIYAGGKVLRGLVARRERERDLCLGADS
jgi:lysozyme